MADKTMHAILVQGFCIHMHINASLGAMSYTCSLLVHLTSVRSVHSVTNWYPCKNRHIIKYIIVQLITQLYELLNLIFVVPCIMLYSGEISPTRSNNCVFLFAMALLYMFRMTISPIIRSTTLYMATGELAHWGCY